MTSTSIYTSIKPTYLCIKQHSITKKKYFCKTSRTEPIKYLGSGTYWADHINKHGRQYVETIWLSDLYYDTSISEHALHFSYENDIVKSDAWANLKPENGLDGGCTHCSSESIQKRKETMKRNGTTNNTSPETVQKRKETMKRNGTTSIPSPESIQKAKDTRLRNGTENCMKNPETVQKMLDTKTRNGTTNPMRNSETVQKRKETMKRNGILLFLSLIATRKTYAKCSISRYFPEFKQYY